MTTTQTIQRRDRWADWAVIAVVAIALIVGLIMRESVLSRTAPFSEAGVSGRCPAGSHWLRETGSDPLLRVKDISSGAFDATLEVRSRPLAADVDPILVLDALAFERSGSVAAYETLDTEDVVVRGGVATRRSFAYVQEDNNPYVDQLPVVVQGMDLALRDEDGRVIVVTLLASVDDFDAYQRYYYALVESLAF
jgi:hypothetical protein